MNIQEALSIRDNAVFIAQQGYDMAVANSKLRVSEAALRSEVETLSEDIKVMADELNTMTKAAVILASVSEECTNQILAEITGVINKALVVLFPADPKTIEITKSLYRDTHPHLNLVLKTASGVVRTFNQSGTGLAQVISFLFTACLIDIKGGRKIMVMDELLSGLHPDAKKLVCALMLALSGRKTDPFQFICVEYGMDIGKQYEICKSELSDGLSTATPWESNMPYYRAQAMAN